MVPGSNGVEGHMPALPTTAMVRVFRITDLASGDKVRITLHSRSLGFIPTETGHTGYVRGIDPKKRTVELSPFGLKFLRDLLPASVVVDTENFSAKGLLWDYTITGGEGSFEKYVSA